MASDSMLPTSCTHATQTIKDTKSQEEADEELSVCDEEPHMLPPETGHGYNPLSLGDSLADGKYQIVRKLGWGGYSSAWLARICNDSPSPTFVVLKVLTVNATSGIIQGKFHEGTSWERVGSENPKHPGYKYCLPYQEALVLMSKYGPHITFVTEVLGSNLAALRCSQPKRVFTVTQVKRIVKQILLGLDYLHRDCHLIHTDLKADNILVSLKGTATDIEHELEVNPSQTYNPRFELDLSPDPIITVKSQGLPNFGLTPTLSNLDLKIIDFGCATPIETHYKENDVQPTLLRAPEVFLGYQWSTPIDMWSLGCLVFEILVGTGFIDIGVPLGGLDPPDEICLQLMIELVGPFPESFLAVCSRRDQFFKNDGSLLFEPVLRPSSIEDCLRAYKLLDEADIVPAATFMRRCLTIDPTVRATARELLEDGWLKDGLSDDLTQP